MSLLYQNYLPIDFPNTPASGANSLAVPLLNQLSGSTTIIGAWSTGRQLSNSATFPYTTTNSSLANHNAAFTTVNGISVVNTADLISFSAGGSLSISNFVDQTGNGNALTIPVGGLQPSILRTGALNVPLTTAGGSMPLVSMGYNGINGGTFGPWLRNALMAVSFGAVSSFGVITVLRQLSGQGQVAGEFASYCHTGDSASYNAVTSCALNYRFSSTTSGAVVSTRNNANLSNGTAPVGSQTMIANVWNGSTNTLYIDRTAQTAVASTGNLGSGGAYAMGNEASLTGAGGTFLIAADIAEQIIFAAWTSADLTLMMNNMRAFWATP